MKLITGLYEAPITVALEAGLAQLTQLQPTKEPITVETAPVSLAHPSVAAVGGSWMVAADQLAAGRWDEVAARCAATTRMSAPDVRPDVQGVPA